MSNKSITLPRQSNFSKVGRWIAGGLIFLLLVALLLQVAKDNMPKGEVRGISGYVPWSKETLELASTLPVQEGGRIKPLSTQAGFTMLGFHGARSMKIKLDNGKVHTLTPIEWMLDSIFRPKLAVDLPTFRIDNSKVLENAGIKVRGQRDRYSYTDLESGRDKLIELAKSYEGNKEEKPDQVKQQTIDLAYNIRNYEALLGYMSFARSGVTLVGTATENSPDRRADISDIMLTAPVIKKKLDEDQAKGLQVNPQIQNLLQQVVDLANFSKFGLFLVPPATAEDTTWQTAGNAIWSVMMQESKDSKTSVEDIKALEKLVRSMGADDSDFRKELTKVHERFVKRAQDRGEYKWVEKETKYYQSNQLLRGMITFLLATLTALAMWMAGGGRPGKILMWITAGLTAYGLVMCVLAIIQRCYIMQRPPVGNLYETIVFIGTSIVFLCLLVEWMTKRRFAVGIAPILGAALIILSRRYELGEAKDHMDPLVAVLDSNFWLTYHVITITLGYCAGLLSAVLSLVYILMRGLNLDGGDNDLRRSLTRAVYGMLCFTLFLSLVGTVLGGIWANYSWGRFWGWDPKENGALLIVIWSLAILHARLGGYVREWGLHLASVFTACVVVFSWWHVNFLGVGLHNYGFTAEKKWMVWIFYASMGLVMLFGAIVMQAEKNRRKIGATAS
jgi:ABC-type transport system involved in cytochrome c biogenesis permease subunit